MDPLAQQVAAAFGAAGMTLVTAESCTGGMVAAALTDLPGASDWFEGGFVTYRLSAKYSMLRVNPATVARHTAVSEPVAREMAFGALAHSSANVSVSVTGVAGPAGGDPMAMVGRVWLGFARRHDNDPAAPFSLAHSQCLDLDGDRAAVREQAVTAALQGLLRLAQTR